MSVRLFFHKTPLSKGETARFRPSLMFGRAFDDTFDDTIKLHFYSTSVVRFFKVQYFGHISSVSTVFLSFLKMLKFILSHSPLTSNDFAYFFSKKFSKKSRIFAILSHSDPATISPVRR